MKRTTAIILYNDLPLKNSIKINFPADSIYLLDFAVLKSNVLQIRSLVSSITKNMINEETPIYMIRSIYYSVINILIKGLLKFEALEDESKLNIANSTVFIDSCTVEQLVGLVKETADKVCELMIDSSRIVRNSLIKEVLKFIEDNYLSPDFSIQFIAEHFNMTVSNFSNYFKNNTQKNFKMYVDYLRIDKAKELLEETSKSIEEIAKKVCYSNASNFSRHFKKMVGITPGEYRKNHLY